MLSDPCYWLDRSDYDVAQTLTDLTISEHKDIAVEDDALQAVVAYSRAFTYAYADPMTPLNRLKRRKLWA